jgi:hypothetical protein
VPYYIALLENETRIKVAASKAQSVPKPLGKLQKHHCINREQMEAVMSRPLFALTAISAFGLSFMTTSLVYGSFGSGHEDLGERAAIVERAGVRHYPTSWENQIKYGWKKYGCFDKMNKELRLAPMWCEGNARLLAMSVGLVPMGNSGQFGRSVICLHCGDTDWVGEISPPSRLKK